MSRRTLNVVLFTRGRGSTVLSRELVVDPRIQLTLAINGYDDGLSTGEVRRFLGDCLGPSDFRKNASRLASSLGTAPPALIELLDLRFPDGYGRAEALGALRAVMGSGREGLDATGASISRSVATLSEDTRAALASRVEAIVRELEVVDRPFSFADCSVGNLAFAGSFLYRGRRFNDAVDDYSALLGLPAGLIENVTDGTNAHLVALLDDGRLLRTEAEIVTADKPQRIRELYLVDHVLSDAEVAPGVEGRGSRVQRMD